jgi:hypothetical protein
MERGPSRRGRITRKSRGAIGRMQIRLRDAASKAACIKNRKAQLGREWGERVVGREGGWEGGWGLWAICISVSTAVPDERIACLPWHPILGAGPLAAREHERARRYTSEIERPRRP